MTTDHSVAPEQFASSGEAEAAPAAFDPKPAEELHQLDFMLGAFRCEYVEITLVPPRTGVSYWTTEPALGGHVYEMLQDTPGVGIHSRWTFGWDATDQVFFTTYYDDWGNHGSTRCTGWEDGYLNFIGEYSAFGSKFVFNERFVVLGADHYRKEGFVREGDNWKQLDVIDCYRITDPQA